MVTWTSRLWNNYANDTSVYSTMKKSLKTHDRWWWHGHQGFGLIMPVTHVSVTQGSNSTVKKSLKTHDRWWWHGHQGFDLIMPVTQVSVTRFISLCHGSAVTNVTVLHCTDNDSISLQEYLLAWSTVWKCRDVYNTAAWVLSGFEGVGSCST